MADLQKSTDLQAHLPPWAVRNRIFAHTPYRRIRPNHEHKLSHRLRNSHGLLVKFLTEGIHMTLHLALIAKTFPTESNELDKTLKIAKEKGGEVALLPECPAQTWIAATKNISDTDAEPMGGPRETRQAAAARSAEIALLGGSIEICKEGNRLNTAVFWDSKGNEKLRYSKMHIPDEPGFREAAHYNPSGARIRCTEHAGWRIGVQICSDNQRPTGCQMLAALGCDLILNPRATERTFLETWITIWRANAITTGCWIASVNRPEPESGVPLGGPSVLIDPFGKVQMFDDPLTVVSLERQRVLDARRSYPGYLAIPSDSYANLWKEIPPRQPWPEGPSV